MAVLAMDEPDKVAKVVPPRILTMDSLPGTREIMRSMESMALKANPVWNSTSPIRTNNGIGVKQKLPIEAEVLRAHWAKPAASPRNSHAPSKFTDRKAKTTGVPMAIKRKSDPSSRIKAMCHSMLRLLAQQDGKSGGAGIPAPTWMHQTAKADSATTPGTPGL